MYIYIYIYIYILSNDSSLELPLIHEATHAIVSMSKGMPHVYLRSASVASAPALSPCNFCMSSTLPMRCTFQDKNPQATKHTKHVISA